MSSQIFKNHVPNELLIKLFDDIFSVMGLKINISPLLLK